MSTVGKKALAWLVVPMALIIGGHVRTAGAVATSANFREEADLPNSGIGPRVLEALGRSIGAGPELTEADEISNPSMWSDSFTVDFDPVNRRIVLTPSGSNDYQTIDIVISNIAFSGIGERVSGIVALSDTIIGPGSAPFTRTLSFTDNSVTIRYHVNNIAAGDSFDFSDGQAVFALQAAAAPAPVLGSASMLLLVVVLTGFAGFRLRRATVRV